MQNDPVYLVTLDGFRDVVMQALAAMLPGAEITAKDGSAIVVSHTEHTATIFLDNGYFRYQQTGNLALCIEDMLAPLRDRGPNLSNTFTTWAEGRHQARLKLSERARILAASNDPANLPVFWPWQEGLSISAVFDSPSSVQYATVPQLTKLGVERPDFYAEGLANLRATLRLKEPHASTPFPGQPLWELIMVASGDTYSSAAVLLPDLLLEWANPAWPDMPHFLVAIPHRDMIMLAPIRRELDYGAMLAGLITFLHRENPYPLTDALFICDGETVRPLSQGSAN